MELVCYRRIISQTAIPCLIGLWILALASSAAAQPPISVSGRVLKGLDGHAAAGVSVSLRQGSEPIAVVRTLDNGYFALKAPAPGPYRIVAIGSEGRSRVYGITVPVKGLDGLSLKLESGVLRLQDGDTLPKAQLAPIRIHVVDSTGAPVLRGTLQAWVVWSPIPPVVAAAPGYAPAVGEETPSRQEEAMDDEDVEAFPFAPGDESAWGIWSGKIRAAPEGIEVESPPEPVPVVPCRVGIGVRSALFGCGRLLLDAWPDHPVTVKLARCGSMHLSVTSEMEGPAERVRVSVVGTDLDPCMRFLQGWLLGTTGETGELNIPAVAAGRYSVRLRPIALWGSPQGLTQVVEMGADKMDLAITIHDRPQPRPNPATDSLDEPQAPFVSFMDGRASQEDRMIWGENGVGAGNDEREGTSGKGRLPLSLCLINLPLSFMDAQRRGQSLDVPAAGVPAGVVTGPRPTANLNLSLTDGSLVRSGQIRVWITSLHSTSATCQPVARGGGMKVTWNGADLPSPADPIVIRVQHDTAGWAEARLPHWPDAPVPLELEQGASLSCKVLDEGGKPMAGVSVALSSGVQTVDAGFVPDSCLISLRTGDSGRVEFPQLPPGTYQLQVSANPADGRRHRPIKTMSKRVTVEKANLDVTLQPDNAR